MSYIPDATVVTEPVDTQAASSAALELRTLKLYLRDVLLAGLTGKLNLTGGVLTGTLGSAALTALRVNSDGAALVFYNVANTVRSGYLQFNAAAGGLILSSEAAGFISLMTAGTEKLRINTAGTTTLSGSLVVNTPSYWAILSSAAVAASFMQFNQGGTATAVGYLGTDGGAAVSGGAGTNFVLRAENSLYLASASGTKSIVMDNVGNYYPGSNATQSLGLNANRWTTVFALAANFTGNVTASSFSGDGSALTNLPAGTITNAQVLSALGFTPYNSSNPANYISSLSNAQLLAILGYTPYNNTNPANYISSINSGMVVTALGYTPYNNTNPTGFITGISSANINTALGFTVGNNAVGTRTVSISAPTGGNDGDIWYQV